MHEPVIKVENISKLYRLGIIGRSMLREDFHQWWRRVIGKPDPAPSDSLMISGHDDKFSSHIWALRDISFKVDEGEVLGIIGRNGAGKSTLLKILSRVTAPTSGRIIIEGRIASLLEVGTGFHPELTGRENIFLNGAILGMTRQEVKTKFDEIVAFAEVEKFIDTPVKRYSSGMYVRLAFAVAAHLEPEILIVDEVLAVGDAGFQKKCLGKMGDVSKEGRTVLFVSHNMAAVQKLCTRCILLDSGECMHDGAVYDVVNSYMNFGVQRTSADFGSDTARSGNGRGCFTRIRLLDDKGEEVNLIPMGGDFTVEMEFKNNGMNCSPVFGVRVHTGLNQNIVSWRSLETSGKAPYAHEGGTVFLHIKNLNLLPGVYYLSLGLSDGHQTFDLIENALEFEVIPSVEHIKGRLPRPEWGFMFTPCDWSFNYK